MAPHANDSEGNATGISMNCAADPTSDTFTVESPNVKYTNNDITSSYTYRTTEVNIEQRQVCCHAQGDSLRLQGRPQGSQDRYDVGRMGWKQWFHRHCWNHRQSPWSRLGYSRRSSCCKLLRISCHGLHHQARHRRTRLERRSTSPSMMSCQWFTPMTLSLVVGTSAA